MQPVSPPNPVASAPETAAPRRAAVPSQWWMVSGFWLLIALASGLEGWLFISGDLVESLRYAGLQWLPWALLTPVIVWISSAYTLERSTWPRYIWIHLAACVVMVGALGALAYVQGPPPFPRGEGRPGNHGGPPPGSDAFAGPHGPPGTNGFMRGDRPPPSGEGRPFPRSEPGGPHHERRGRPMTMMILRLATFQLPTFWAVVGVAHALLFYQSAKERERRAVELESRLAQARLQALRMQLNPHFLFNTLNSVASLLHDDPKAADDMIASLSDLLRLALDESDRQELTLREELHFLDRYLLIEQARFGDRLQIEKQIDPAALDAMVPILILQPLVENAVKHGLEAKLGPGVIAIAASCFGNALHLQVADNGRGVTAPGGQFKEGVGLGNTRSRLRELYGKRATFDAHGREQGGFLVEITIPLPTAAAPTTPAAPGPTT